MAGLYKNLGKLGEHEEFLQKGLDFLRKARGNCCMGIRWTLQLIAFKSSAKKYHSAYNKTRRVLSTGLEDPNPRTVAA
jgi:hypothetical protein